MTAQEDAPDDLAAVEAGLREFALGFPGATEDFPWGHLAVKVKGKAFLFMSRGDDGGLGLSFKLRASHGEALLMPFASPTGYGLGRAGWVSARFAPGDAVPLGMLRGWIDESYRLIAPKRMVAQLRAPAGASTSSA